MRLIREENPKEIAQYLHIKAAPYFGPVRCFSQLPGGEHTCDLADGHTGPHVAHIWYNKVAAVWDDHQESTPSH